MKNTLGVGPYERLTGRLLHTVRFIRDGAIERRNILNIGCGFGWFEVNAMQRRCASIVAMEPNPDDLTALRDALSDDRLTFLAGDASCLPLANGSVHTVTMFDVLEHVPRGAELAVFREIYRVLAPGGALYLSVPHRSFFSNITDPAWWLIGHRHYSLARIEEFAASVGLSVERSDVRGAWWEVLAVLNLYVSKWVFRRDSFFKEFFAEKASGDYAKKGFFCLFLEMKKDEAAPPVKTKPS